MLISLGEKRHLWIKTVAHYNHLNNKNNFRVYKFKIYDKILKRKFKTLFMIEMTSNIWPFLANVIASFKQAS